MAKKKTVRERTKALKDSYAALLAAMPVIGASREPPNGLGDLAGRVAGAETLLPDGEVTVSQWDKSVYPGDMVALTRELEGAGEPVTMAADHALLLGAAAVAGAVVSLFVQEGETFLKAARWGGESWSLGSTKPFLDKELTQATLIPFRLKEKNWLAVAYPEDGAGMIQFWEAEDLILTHRGTDIWTDDDPVNLCGDWGQRSVEYGIDSGSKTQYYGLMTLCYQATDGSIQAVGVEPTLSEDGQTMSAGIYAQKNILPGEVEGKTMPQGRTKDFVIPATDGQSYYSRAWTLTADSRGGTVWLVYPGQDGRRYVLELWTMEDHFTETAPRVYKYEPGGCEALLQSGYLPCGAGAHGLNGQYINRNGVYLVGGISRLSGPNQRSSVGVEIWMGGYAIQLTPLWFGEDQQKYSSNVGLVSACVTGEQRELLAVGFKAEGKYYAMLLGEGPQGQMAGGPSVELGEVWTAGELTESGQGAALVWQGEDGSVNLRQYQTRTVAIPTRESALANAQAVTGGRPGQKIRIRGLGK